MASRRLALNLNQALRSRTALNSVRPIRRGLATPVDHSVKTESTTLSNGLTVGYNRGIYDTRQPLTGVDRNRTLAMGADVHRWGVDRCRESSGDRQDQWHGTLPGAPCVQGMGSLTCGLARRLIIFERERKVGVSISWSSRSRTWEATSMRTPLYGPLCSNHETRTYAGSVKTLYTTPSHSTPTSQPPSTSFPISSKTPS